tara:strand:- start:909 stop:1895 length:987 start_codon:yes stop_codon:yes gene_type:complete
VSTNVLLLTPYSFKKYGGVQSQVNLIEEYLDTHEEFNVKVFAHGKHKKLNKSMIFNIPFNSSVSSVMLFPNRKLLKKHLMWADVVHVHEPFVPILFWRLPKNIKYVFTHHAALNPFVLFLLKVLYKLFSFNSSSTHVSKDSKNNALTLSENSQLIPNMIKINKDVSFSGESGYLFIGRQEKRKNIKLFKLLSNHKNFKNLRFIAITNKNFESNIEVYINPNDIQKNKIFQLTNIYLALNTRSESFGITILEAINNGNLAITSNLNAFKNVLVDSHIIFKNNNLDSLIQVLYDLEKSKLADLWKNQYEEIKKYDLDKNMKEFISIYTKV